MESQLEAQCQGLFVFFSMFMRLEALLFDTWFSLFIAGKFCFHASISLYLILLLCLQMMCPTLLPIQF